MKAKKMLAILVVALGLMVWQVEVSEAEPMGTAWTYQGRLIDANSAAEGLYDFQFKLFNDPCTGAQQGSTVDVNDLDVIDGYFTVELDFGSDVFDGDARWLEVGVRPGDSNDPNAFVSLSPRMELTPTPYAIYAKRSKDADDADKLDGFDSSAFAVAAHSHGGVYALISHTHSGSDITAGAVADARIADTIARDSELTWGNLDNIPDGFADGIDNIGGADSDWIISGYDMYSAVAGNVGIGTMSPSHLLDVDGSLRLRQSGGGNPAASLIELGNRAGGRTYGINFNAYYDDIWKYRSSDEAASIGFEANGDLVFSTMASGTANSGLTFSPRITIKNNGDVGIGTTSPDAQLEVAGDVKVTGAYRGNISSSSGSDGAPFPRPAYDSGWVPINMGEEKTMNHDIGGNVDNYVVDMQCRDSGSDGINNRGTGGDWTNFVTLGVYWYGMSTSQIKVVRENNNYFAESVRIRIWVYN